MALSHDLHVDELLERVLEKSGTLDTLEAERTIEARGRIENLQELVGVAREYRQQAEEASLGGFLQDISLVSDQDTIRDERGLVTLMTLHNAKGLEFRAVFMIGMEEGIFPHSRSIEEQEIEEERRLCYVGMTRAMERLTMTHTMARSLFGRREYNLAVALPRRAPGRRSSASGCGRPRGAATAPPAARGYRSRVPGSRSRPATPFATARSAKGSSPGSSRAESLRFGSRRTERSGGSWWSTHPWRRSRELQGRAVREPRGVRPGGLRDRAVLRFDPTERAHGALLEEPADRAHARSARGRRDRRRRRRVPVRAHRARRRRTDGRRDGRRARSRRIAAGESSAR